MIKDIIGIFRPLRWYRNSFMVLGSALAILLLNKNPLDFGLIGGFMIGFIAICLIASGNYGINEILDAPFDKFHPQKKNRAIPSGRVSSGIILIISIILYILGLALTLLQQNIMLTLSALLLLISGILYNVPPFRFKDKPYLDFLFEAINNPIRLLVGWYAVAAANQIVPSSFIMTYWFLGIFLMTAKRFGEFRFVKKEELVKYRKSFKYYNEQKLLFVMIAAVNASSFMLGALSMKYSIDLILFLPILIIWIIWFFKLAYEVNSIVKDPERIFENIPFTIYSVITFSSFIILIMTKTNILGFLTNN